MINHANLVILTPGHSLTSDYVKSLLSTIAICAEKGISVAWYNDYASNVFDAREITINGSPQCSVSQNLPFNGQMTYDKLLWIDSDISWSTDDFLKLYNSDKDIISGAYLSTNGNVMAFKEVLGRPFAYSEILEKTDLEEISAAGFGFLCIKNGVFESLSRPWFQQDEALTFIDGKEESFKILGEDIAFFSRIKKIGYQVWLDPTVKVVHTKTMRLTWEGIQP